jgi:nitrogen fixation/metabolism regulation signal transduction histidine kinase
MRHRTGTVGIPRRVLISVTLVLAITVSLTWILSRFIANPFGVIAIGTACAFPIGFLVNKLIIGPVRAILVALGDGLLSFTEKDYGVRIARARDIDLGEIVTRFNRLGEMLKTEHNDIYQREILLENVLESVPAAVLLLNEAQHVIFANATARELFFAKKKMEGLPLADVLARNPESVREALRAEGDILFSIDRGGSEETFAASRRYFSLSTQQHTLIVVKSLAREMAQKEAEVWKKAIRIISHELNNSLAPITSLIHSARVIIKNPEHAHRLENVFDTIEDRGAHLKNFLDGYARLAKLPRPTPQKVSWGEFLAGLQHLFAFRIASDVPTEPGWFDPAQMEQVLINLLKNAVESGSAPDEVCIEVAEKDDGCELRVLDRGKGMTDDVLRSAVLPFYSTKKTGSGLGLALCRDIVDAHGGKLSIAPRDGGGMIVSVWLPGRRLVSSQVGF